MNCMYFLGVYFPLVSRRAGGPPTRKVNFHHLQGFLSTPRAFIQKMWALEALRQERQTQNSTCIGQWRGCFRSPGSSWSGKSETGLLMAPQQAPWYPARSGHIGDLRQETMCFNLPLLSPEVALLPTPQPCAGTKDLWQGQSICSLLRWGNQGWEEDILQAGSNSFQNWDVCHILKERMWTLVIMMGVLVHTQQAPMAELWPVLGWASDLHIADRTLPLSFPKES